MWTAVEDCCLLGLERKSLEDWRPNLRNVQIAQYSTKSMTFLHFPKVDCEQSLSRAIMRVRITHCFAARTLTMPRAFTDFRAKERPIAVYPKRDLEGRITILINSGRAESKAGHLELCPWSCARGPLVCRGSWDGATDWWSELIAKRSSE